VSANQAINFLDKKTSKKSLRFFARLYLVFKAIRSKGTLFLLLIADNDLTKQNQEKNKVTDNTRDRFFVSW